MAKDIKELFEVNKGVDENVSHVELLAEDPNSKSRYVLVTTNHGVLKVKL